MSLSIAESLPKDLKAYAKLRENLGKMTAVEQRENMRWLGRHDLFFLLRYLLKKPYFDHPFLLARCREVQQEPNGYLDLWARGHCKSTIITQGLTIQDILNDPEMTAAVLSYNRPTSKAFLNQIKSDFENNNELVDLYDDILYKNPDRESPKWSSDEGLRVKRKTNPKENTLEAWGLIDAMPTGRHFKLLIYDDVVTLDATVSPESMQKVTTAWEMSDNLSCGATTKVRYIGTRYHFADTYGTMIKRGVCKLRIHPAEVNGKPVFLDKDTLDKKRQVQGPYVFASQMMLNPLAEGNQIFLPAWLKYYRETPERCAQHKNLYLLCDPATSKRKGSDYTSMWVIALGSDENYYFVDGVRKRLSLTERADWLFKFQRKWKPLEVGYERYGMQADIEHIKERMERESYRFEITELAGKEAKRERIGKLVPLFENGRMYLPEIGLGTHEPHFAEAVNAFVNDEYSYYPVAANDDALDNAARVVDPALGAEFPEFDSDRRQETYDRPLSIPFRPYR